MADGTEYLQEKKESLDHDKKTRDEENEELEKQLKAKEEALVVIAPSINPFQKKMVTS